MGEMDLLDALGLPVGNDARRGMAVLSFVGAGGKTSLIFTLAAQAASQGHAVLVTTTTRMWDPHRSMGGAAPYRFDRLFLDPASLGCAQRLPASITILGMGIEGATGKLIGIAPDFPAGFEGLFDLVLVEADGAHGLPVKAPASHEPVLAVGSDAVVGVIGLDALGAAASDLHVHRLSRFLEIVGMPSDGIIGATELRALVEHPLGLFKDVQAPSRRILVLNKADLRPDASWLAACRTIALAGSIDRTLAVSRGCVVYSSSWSTP